MTDRYIIRQAPWWEIVRISTEGKQAVVATAATEQEAQVEAERRAGQTGFSERVPPAPGPARTRDHA